MSTLNATISFRSGLGYFPALDPDHVYELKRMASGHLGLAFHDDGTRHRRFKISTGEIFETMQRAEAAFAEHDSAGKA